MRETINWGDATFPHPRKAVDNAQNAVPIVAPPDSVVLEHLLSHHARLTRIEQHLFHKEKPMAANYQIFNLPDDHVAAEGLLSRIGSQSGSQAWLLIAVDLSDVPSTVVEARVQAVIAQAESDLAGENQSPQPGAAPVAPAPETAPAAPDEAPVEPASTTTAPNPDVVSEPVASPTSEPAPAPAPADVAPGDELSGLNDGAPDDDADDVVAPPAPAPGA